MKSLKNLTGDALEQMIDYKVVDQNGDEIGSLHSLWSDPDTGSVEFLGVRTGWIFGQNHVVPADKAELDEAVNLVRLPYTEAFIKEAPAVSADSEISEAEEQNIYRYYGTTKPGAEAPGTITPDNGSGTSNVAETAADAGVASSAAAPVAGGNRLRRTTRQDNPGSTSGTAESDADAGPVTGTSAASVSPDTTGDQLPSNAPAATYPTANLYGSTGSSTVPTTAAAPATTDVPADTSTTGAAGRGLDTAGGTDPEMSETKNGQSR